MSDSTLREHLRKDFEEKGGYAALMHLHRQDHSKDSCFCTTHVSGAYVKVLDVIEALCQEVAREANGCPCLLIKPCGYACSCANANMSGGCMSCCRYGSLEQRLAAANRIKQLTQKPAKETEGQ